MATRESTPFGRELRRLRLEAGFSQESLAERAGLSLDAVRALERGRRTTPRAETVALLAEALLLQPADRATLIATAYGTPAAPAEAPAQAAPPGVPALAPGRSAALPLPPSPLLGREREEAVALSLLQSGEVRLLTLTGSGGVGKTRLALTVASRAREAYPDGVVFVDLSALRGPALVLVAIAETLGVREGEGQSLPDVLARYLGERQTLLVLDNFEQVIEAAPRVADLLATCPHLVVLVTSRTALRVRAEHCLQVPPLAIPPSERSPLWQEVVASPAVQLFAERARAIQPSFLLEVTNGAAVTEICRRLDGLPLAIELAAARVALLPPGALLQRLEGRLAVLGRGARDLPARQQTLQATLDWSYDLLTAEQQLLFRRLAVFAGGATLEAIEAICGSAGADGALDVWEGLSALVEHNLLRQGPAAAEGNHGGEPRFTMLETIREYALQQLAASGEMDTLRREHATYFMALAEEAEPAPAGADRDSGLARLEHEHDNLRAALTWTLESGGAAAGVQPGTALWRYWHLHGHLSEARAWLERLLVQDDQAPGDETALARATALAAAAWTAQSQGEFPRARELLEASLTLHRTLGQVDGLSDLLINGALIATIQGDHRRAEELLEENLALHRSTGNRGTIGEGGLGLALLRLGLVRRNQGAYAQAAALYEECLALHQELGDREGVALALLGLGDIARDQGHAEQASAHSAQSLALFEELAVPWGRGFALNNLAQAAHLQGDLAQALALAEESVALFRDLGEGMSLAEALTSLGRILRAAGEVCRVGAVLHESLQLAWARGPRWCVAADLEECAALAFAQGQAPRSARLLGAAAALRQAMGAPLPASLQADWAQNVAATRAALGDLRFEQEWTAGQDLPLEQSVAAALDLTP